MKLSDLLAEHARPYEISHQSRWIALLRDKANAESSEDLRTIVATHPDQLRAADALVRKRYAWRGYKLAGEAAGPAPSEDRVTLLAEARGELVGTLTVRPRAPFFVEHTYAAEIDRLRQAGHRLGEVVKLAVEVGAGWKGALDALVQGAYLVSRVLHALTHVVIEVNPRHVRFYDKVLGFTAVASGGVCARVAAPSVLMMLDLELFGRRVHASLAKR